MNAPPTHPFPQVRDLLSRAHDAAEQAADARTAAERAVRQARRAAAHAGSPDDLSPESPEPPGSGEGVEGSAVPRSETPERVGSGRPASVAPSVRASTLGDNVEAPSLSASRLPRESARASWSAWQEAEGAYLRSLDGLFARMRRERADHVQYLVSKRAAFLEFLHAPDERQAMVDRALAEVRQRAPSTQQPSVRAEAVEVVDRLRDQLWDACDAKNAEGDRVRKAVAAESFVADHERATVGLFQELIAIEAKRLYDTGEGDEREREMWGCCVFVCMTLRHG